MTPEDPEPEDTYGDDSQDENVHSDDWGDTENNNGDSSSESDD